MVTKKVKKQVDELFDTVSEGMNNHWLYCRNEDNSARFVLGEHGENPLICIGVNPSTAEPDNLDNTLRCVKAWSKRLGFGGWIMLNLYPQRATNPNDLHKICCPELLDRNVGCWEKILEQYYWSKIWAAWGTMLEKRKYLVECLEAQVDATPTLELLSHKWITIGKRSIAGHPHHPLYLSVKSEVSEFDICEYLKILKGR